MLLVVFVISFLIIISKKCGWVIDFYFSIAPFYFFVQAASHSFTSKRLRPQGEFLDFVKYVSDIANITRLFVCLLL